MAFINESAITGQVISKLNTYVTGSETLTYVGLLLVLVGILSALKVPIEFQTLFLIPILLVLMAFNSSFMIPGGIVLFIIAVFIVKYSFFD